MNSPDIEHLIDQAITNRPKTTNASMNLYVFNGRVICGARVVMPKSAALVAHLAPQQLEDRFSGAQWKLLVEKTKRILQEKHCDSNVNGYVADKSKHQLIDNERRNESRLPYRRPIWFADDLREKLNKAVMCDISSSGIAFTCHTDGNHPQQGRQITARFDVPKLADNGLPTSVRFDRIGRICRIEKINDSLNRIAVQFTTPLPFKPAQQLDNQPADLLNVPED